MTNEEWLQELAPDLPEWIITTIAAELVSRDKTIKKLTDSNSSDKVCAAHTEYIKTFNGRNDCILCELEHVQAERDELCELTYNFAKGDIDGNVIIDFVTDKLKDI